MAKPDEKKVAVKEENLPATINFAADAGGGFEDAGASCYAIPFLTILQSGSPQCKRSEGAYVKGAAEGMFFNSVTGEIYDGDKGIVVVPCYFNQTFNEWTPRDSGGGIVGVYNAVDGEEYLTTCKKNDKNQDVLPSGNILADTRNHYLLLVKEDGTIEPVFMPLGSTQIKKSKRWMTLMQNIKMGHFNAPMFSQSYHLTTVPESNDKGSWFGLKVDHKAQLTDIDMYNSAKSFRELVRSGNAKPADTGEEEVPF